MPLTSLHTTSTAASALQENYFLPPHSSDRTADTVVFVADYPLYTFFHTYICLDFCLLSVYDINMIHKPITKSSRPLSSSRACRCRSQLSCRDRLTSGMQATKQTNFPTSDKAIQSMWYAQYSRVLVVVAEIGGYHTVGGTRRYSGGSQIEIGHKIK
jgi:hypothetical protein